MGKLSIVVNNTKNKKKLDMIALRERVRRTMDRQIRNSLEKLKNSR